MSLTSSALAERVARAALRTFSDLCAVYVLGDGGLLNVAAVAARDDKTRSKAVRPLESLASSGQGFVYEAMRSGQNLTFSSDGASGDFINESAAQALHATGMHAAIVLPILIGSSAAGVVCFFRVAVSFERRDVRCAHAVARQFSLALENASLRERQQRIESRTALLRDATDRLFSTPEEHEMLEQLLEVLVQQFAERAVAVELHENQLQPIASAGACDDERLCPEGDERVLIDAIRRQRPFLANPMYSQSWMMSPLFVTGRPRGALLCYSNARRYDSEDMETLRELCQRTSLALEYADSFARERRLAQTLQRATLPPNLARLPGAITSVVYRPASQEEQVGGDWYDVFSLDEDRVLVTIGDVTGHGVPSWSIMSKLRHTINAVAKYEENPARLLDAVEPIVQQRYPDAIATAFVAIVNRRRRSITYANAGHPSPVLRRSGNTIEQLRAEGLPIGLRQFCKLEPRSERTNLDGIDLLVFYTDGLTESTRNIIDGERRLVHALEREAAVVTSDSAEFIKSACLRGPLPDDVAILALNFVPMDRWKFESNDQSAAQQARREFCDLLHQKEYCAEDSAAGELIFGEVVSNVARHAPGTVEAALEWSGRRAVLHVLDRGPGYHAETPTRADVLSESGRGLWLVNRIGGQIEIEPLPGFGMHTRVVLPFSDSLVSHVALSSEIRA